MRFDIMASSHNLTAGAFDLRPSVMSDPESHGGDEVLFVLKGNMNVYLPDSFDWFEVHPLDCLYLPEGTKEQEDYFNEMQRVTTSAENAVALQRVFADIDVTGYLSKVTTPTLVGHSTRDAVVPFSSGRALAARIPGARFIAIESPNHLLLETDPGWPKYARVVEEFLET